MPRNLKQYEVWRSGVPPGQPHSKSFKFRADFDNKNEARPGD